MIKSVLMKQLLCIKQYVLGGWSMLL